MCYVPMNIAVGKWHRQSALVSVSLDMHNEPRHALDQLGASWSPASTFLESGSAEFGVVFCNYLLIHVSSVAADMLLR